MMKLAEEQTEAEGLAVTSRLDNCLMLVLEAVAVKVRKLSTV